MCVVISGARCADCASAKTTFLPVARAAQAPKQLFRPLRGLRKRRNNFFARCAGCASIKTTFVPVARAAQAPKQLFCPLRGLRKS
jgi:hypothetical protein